MSLLLLVIFLLSGGWSASAADKNLVSSIQKILEDEEKERTKLDTRLIESLKDMQSTSITENQGDLLEAALLRVETKVTDVKTALAENHQRIEFLNAFITSIESVTDVRADAPRLLVDLAHKDLLASIETGIDSKTWLFEIYLSIALRDIMEPSENYADFIKKFIAYSTLREPRSPGDFMKDRKYLGGPQKTSKNEPTPE